MTPPFTQARDPNGILVHLPSGRRLGKRPPKLDPRTLRLSRYVAHLPPPPPVIDHCSFVPSWPMYANDRLGCCGPAGLAHQIQSWSVYAQAPVTPTEQEVVDAYFSITGGKDSGVYLLDMLNWYRRHPITGTDTLEAFVQISPNATELEWTHQIFGSVGMGLSLPDGPQTYGPWIDVPDVPPNPRNGHYVCGVGHDRAAGLIKVVTWGRVELMSYGFFLKYCDEAFALANNLSLIEASGTTPEGFDWPTLEHDLQHLGDPVDPPTPPPGPSCGKRLQQLALAPLWPSGVRI